MTDEQEAMESARMSELKPCAHCEGSAYVADDYSSSFQVKCNNPICGASVRLWGTCEGAIAAWNRRPSAEALVEELARMVDHFGEFAKDHSMEATPETWAALHCAKAALAAHRSKTETVECICPKCGLRHGGVVGPSESPF